MSGPTFTNAATNIALDGNSIMAGSQLPATTPSSKIGDQLMALAPISGAMTHKNLAVGGYTFQQMLRTVQKVHNAFEPGKQNILFVLEGCNTSTGNSAFGDGPSTGPQIVAHCQAYIDAVKTAHPEWRIFLLTATAVRVEQSVTDTVNPPIDYFNDYIRQNYAAMGCEGVVDTRPTGGALSYFAPYTNENPANTGWFERPPRHYRDATHLSGFPDPFAWGNGSGIVAQYMADSLAAMPAVAPPPGNVATNFAQTFAILAAAAPATVFTNFAQTFAILAAPATADISKVSISRIVIFEGSGPRLEFLQMTAKPAYKVGDQWFSYRDPDEESRYAADITDELTDRMTTAVPGEIKLVLAGVTALADPVLETVSIAGSPRTFVIAFLGPDAGPIPDDWSWAARVRCANGELFDKTTYFKRKDG